MRCHARLLKPLALSLAVCLSSLSCAGLQRHVPVSPSPTPPIQLQQEHVALTVELVDADQTKDIFGTDLVARGIQPLVIHIHNGSDQTYAFQKAHIEPRLLPTAEAARRTSENFIVTGLHLVKWLILWIPAIIFPSMRATTHRPALVKDIRADFTREEIPDTTIEPNGSVNGLVFIRVLQPGERIRITLINTQTQQPLAFEVPR